MLPTDSSELIHFLLGLFRVCVWNMQYLEEDPRTNRIDDSLQLFTGICQNKLLAKAALVLMLNKVRASRVVPAVPVLTGGSQADLLRKKLESGIRVRK